MKIRCGAVFIAIVLSSVNLFAQQAPRIPMTVNPIKIVLVGHSTVAVQGGWGPGFYAHLIASAECLDLAADGWSTKSFVDEGLRDHALKQRGQFYFIHFWTQRSEDQVALHTDPQTSFKASLVPPGGARDCV